MSRSRAFRDGPAGQAARPGNPPAVWWPNPRKERANAPRSGPYSQRRPGWSSRVGEDVAARGAPLRGRVRSTGSAPSPIGTPSRTPTQTSRRGRCRSPRRSARCKWQDRKINLLDTPGEPSFVADALGALRVCESAIFVINGVMGVEVTTSRLWARAAELDIARMLFVNMLDRERADFFRTPRAAQARLRPARRRDRDPDRIRARGRGRHRPGRHEGLPRAAHARARCRR